MLSDGLRERVREVLAGCDLVGILARDGMEIQRSGPHMACRCPFHGDTDPSMIIYAADDRHLGQHLHCYGCGWHGDAIRYWMETRSCSFKESITALGGGVAGMVGVTVARPPPPAAPRWTAIRPVPVTAPAATVERLSLKRCGQPARIWQWWDQSMQLICASARYESAGRKEVIRWSWCRDERGRQRWFPSPGPKPWPLYGLWRLAEIPDGPVLVVEGEKTSDAVAAAYPCYACVTWGGGCGAVQRRPEDHDWTPLTGRDLVLIPDLDWETWKGKRAMLVLAHHLTSIAASIKLNDFAGALRPDGWDLADAI